MQVFSNEKSFLGNCLLIHQKKNYAILNLKKKVVGVPSPLNKGSK